MHCCHCRYHHCRCPVAAIVEAIHAQVDCKVPRLFQGRVRHQHCCQRFRPRPASPRVDPSHVLLCCAWSVTSRHRAAEVDGFAQSRCSLRSCIAIKAGRYGVPRSIQYISPSQKFPLYGPVHAMCVISCALWPIASSVSQRVSAFFESPHGFGSSEHFYTKLSLLHLYFSHLPNAFIAIASSP
jgi:hypothetical protein